MAVKDVRQYFFTMLNQYLEEKNNLADFQEALKEGLITEDQMSEVMEIVAGLEANYHRLVYIMYLLDMPARQDKKAAYVRQYKNILAELKALGVDEESIKQENTDALILFKAALNKLKNKDGQ